MLDNNTKPVSQLFWFFVDICFCNTKKEYLNGGNNKIDKFRCIYSFVLMKGRSVSLHLSRISNLCFSEWRMHYLNAFL